MLWMLDEFETIYGGRFPDFITGKPVGMGGSPGRTEATGYGVVAVLTEALELRGIAPDERHRSQHPGVRQRRAARGTADSPQRRGSRGRRVIVGCPGRPGLHLPQAGRHRPRMRCVRLTDGFGSIDKTGAAIEGYEVLPGSEWITQDVDILIPAALENQITARNVVAHRWPRARSSSEAANGPMTAEASQRLEDRGVLAYPRHSRERRRCHVQLFRAGAGPGQLLLGAGKRCSRSWIRG